jgi:hypothetical protein
MDGILGRISVDLPQLKLHLGTSAALWSLFLGSISSIVRENGSQYFTRTLGTHILAVDMYVGVGGQSYKRCMIPVKNVV